MSSTGRFDQSSKHYLPQRMMYNEAIALQIYEKHASTIAIHPSSACLLRSESYCRLFETFPISYWDYLPTIFNEYCKENGVHTPEIFAHLSQMAMTLSDIVVRPNWLLLITGYHVDTTDEEYTSSLLYTRRNFAQYATTWNKFHRPYAFSSIQMRGPP